MSSDDIVERLRGWVPSDFWNRAVGEMRDAADEIERLRAQRDALRFDNAELLDGLERKHDYACRMDALAEERLMQATRLRAAGDALVESYAFVVGHPPEATRAIAVWREASRER